MSSAGDVGRAVQHSPGYGGYIPSMGLGLPTAPPNGRVPLSERHTPSQPPKEPAPGQTIYQSDMTGTLRASLTLSSAGGSPTFGGDTLSAFASGGPGSYAGAGPAAGGSLSPKDSPPSLRSSQGRNRSLPPHKPFLASSLSQDTATSLTGSPEDPAFFSRVVKERNAQQEEQPQTFNQREAFLANSQRGHGGATGLDCLHQPAVVANESGAATLPLKGTAQTPFVGGDRRGACHPERLYGNSVGTLKLHRAPVASTYGRDFGVLGSNPRDRTPLRPQDFAETSATVELATGTTKFVAKKRIPGYMGHIPSAKINVDQLRGDDDALMQFHKSHLLLTCNHNIPGYSGHQPISIYNDTGRPLEPTLELTSSGSVSKYVAEDTVERGMKDVHYGRTNALKAFFTRGEGEDVGQAADMYFQSYRPLEGLLKR